MHYFFGTQCICLPRCISAPPTVDCLSRTNTHKITAKILATTYMLVHTTRHVYRTTHTHTHTHTHRQTRWKQCHLLLSRLVTKASEVFTWSHQPCSSKLRINAYAACSTTAFSSCCLIMLTTSTTAFCSARNRTFPPTSHHFTTLQCVRGKLTPHI